MELERQKKSQREGINSDRAGWHKRKEQLEQQTRLRQNNCDGAAQDQVSIDIRPSANSKAYTGLL